MPVFNVERQRIIKRPLEEVFNTIVDFKKFKNWNPWLIAEPDCSVELSEKTDELGSWYKWNGKLIGSGYQELVSIADDKTEIRQKIEFYKPMKSKSEVYWNLKEEGDDTLVTWGLSGKLPFFLGFMAKMMDGFVGPDYEAGLIRLAKYLDTEVPSYDFTPEGYKELPAQSYIGIPFDPSKPIAEQDWGPNHNKLLAFIKENNIAVIGKAFSYIDKFNLKTKIASGGLAFAVADNKDIETSAPIIKGLIPGGLYYMGAFKGPMNMLSYGWRALMVVYKTRDKKRPMLELYHHDDFAGDFCECKLAAAVKRKL